MSFTTAELKKREASALEIYLKEFPNSDLTDPVEELLWESWRVGYLKGRIAGVKWARRTLKSMR